MLDQQEEIKVLDEISDELEQELNDYEQLAKDQDFRCNEVTKELVKEQPKKWYYFVGGILLTLVIL